MPRGEGQQGKRRGRYKKGQTANPWSTVDRAMYAEFVRCSTLKINEVKQGLARRAVELDRAGRDLDELGGNTNDEKRTLAAIAAGYRKTLEALRLLDSHLDDEPGRL